MALNFDIFSFNDTKGEDHMAPFTCYDHGNTNMMKIVESNINSMIELHYITNDNNELHFTPPGIAHMIRNHKQFMIDFCNNGIDFGSFFYAGLAMDIKEAAQKYDICDTGTVTKFKRDNLISRDPLENESVPYIKSQDAKDGSEPM